MVLQELLRDNHALELTTKTGTYIFSKSLAFPPSDNMPSPVHKNCYPDDLASNRMDRMLHQILGSDTISSSFTHLFQLCTLYSSPQLATNQMEHTLNLVLHQSH